MRVTGKILDARPDPGERVPICVGICRQAEKEGFFIAKIVLIVLKARLCVSFFSSRREGTAFGQDFCFVPDAESLPLGSGARSRKSSEPVHAVAADTGVWTSKYVTSTRAPEK